MSIEKMKTCLALLEKHGVPQNIMDHSLKVNEVAMYLSRKLQESGTHVNLGLVNDASLLHDIDKHRTLNDNSNHGTISEQILLEEGISAEIAACVRKHHLNTILNEKPFDTIEEKIVYYSDKRVMHDKIVSLDERFQYLKKRYGNINEKVLQTIIQAEPKVKELEDEIFKNLKISRELDELKNE
ncbi:MAG: HDIG domain-containing metalloprotein [Candidatus Diapherotrites archaeon]